jgi:hypothetical protein
MQFNQAEASNGHIPPLLRERPLKFQISIRIDCQRQGINMLHASSPTSPKTPHAESDAKRPRPPSTTPKILVHAEYKPVCDS